MTANGNKGLAKCTDSPRKEDKGICHQGGNNVQHVTAGPRGPGGERSGRQTRRIKDLGAWVILAGLASPGV